MTQLAHKTACAQCPWRRKSAPGWLGASNPAEFFRSSIPGEQDMPCHMKVDYEDPDWRETLDDAPHCAGTLVYFRNNVRMPRSPRLAEMVRAVETDPKVFAFESEFMDHHDRRS